MILEQHHFHINETIIKDIKVYLPALPQRFASHSALETSIPYPTVQLYIKYTIKDHEIFRY